MTTYQPAYRATVYVPRSVDPTETTVLTGSGTIHSDPFQVTTLPSLSGFKPYMMPPSGRDGRMDLLARKTDIGQTTFSLSDIRTTAGGSNLSRWVTGLLGAAGSVGRVQFLGCKCLVEESLDGGATWSNYFTGRIVNTSLSGEATTEYTFTVQGMTRDLKAAPCFVGRPHSSVSYAIETSLLPLGPTSWFGTVPAAPTFRGTIQTGDTIALDGPSHGSPYDAFAVGLLQSGVAVSFYLYGGPRVTVREPSSPPTVVRVRIPGGELDLTGVFLDGQVNQLRIASLQVKALAATDPNYVAFPSNGTVVTFSVRNAYKPATEATPILLGDAHPVQVMADLLDGKFGYLKADSTVSIAYPRNSAAFTALLADNSFPNGRFVITATDTVLGWIEQHLCLPFGLVLTENASGEIVPIDVRLPTTLGSYQTITDADLVGETVPQWVVDRTQVISRFTVKTYLDSPIAGTDIASMVGSGNGGILHAIDVPSSLLTSQEVDTLVPDFSLGDMGDQEITVDADGLRACPFEQTQGGDRTQWVQGKALALIEGFRHPYSTGPVTITLTCRRTAVTNAITQGALCVVQCSMVPDPATNLRGGARVGRVLEKSVNALTVTLVILDLGLNATCAVPTVGTLAAGTDTKHQINIPITLNAAGDPARIDYAITPAGTSSAPSATDPLWTMFMRVTSSATYTVSALPSNCRIYVRSRSEPKAAYADKALPSAWATAATAYQDTVAISAPTSLVVSGPSTLAAALGWSNGGNVTDRVQVLLGNGDTQAHSDASTPAVIITLPAGATSFLLSGLDAAGPWYRAQVRFADGLGGFSAVVGTSPTSFQATGTAAQCPAPAGLYNFGAVRTIAAVAPPAGTTSVALTVAQTGIALVAVPGATGYDFVIQEAPDSSGSPGTFADYYIVAAQDLVEAGTIVKLSFPMDGTQRWFRGLLRAQGFSDSPTTANLAVVPGLLPAEGLVAKSVYPLNRGNTLTDGKFAVLADTPAGDVISESVVQTDGASSRLIAKGVQMGAATHGAAVTFAPAFQSTPMVLISGGVNYEPRNKWGATGSGAETGAILAATQVLDDVTALNLAATGFTVRARLRQKGVITGRTANFAGGNSITAAGSTTAIVVANAPANNDQYVIGFQTKITLTSRHGTVVSATLVVSVSADASGSYVTVYTATPLFSTSSTSGATSTAQWVHSVAVSGMTSTKHLRLKIESFTVTGDASASSCEVNGYDGTVGSPTTGLAYNTSADQFASKTPDSDDAVSWIAVGIQ